MFDLKNEPQDAEITFHLSYMKKRGMTFEKAAELASNRVNESMSAMWPFPDPRSGYFMSPEKMKSHLTGVFFYNGSSIQKDPDLATYKAKPYSTGVDFWLFEARVDAL